MGSPPGIFVSGAGLTVSGSKNENLVDRRGKPRGGCCRNIDKRRRKEVERSGLPESERASREGRTRAWGTHSRVFEPARRDFDAFEAV